MTELRFTNEAEADILAIHDYTTEAFGPSQWLLYEQGLRTTFADLRSNPSIGADRSHIKPHVRRMIFRSHVIYYRMDPNEIVVLRILHIRQDPGRHL